MWWSGRNPINFVCSSELLQKNVVYYETIKWWLNKRLIYECRCDERPRASGKHKIVSRGSYDAPIIGYVRGHGYPVIREKLHQD